MAADGIAQVRYLANGILKKSGSKSASISVRIKKGLLVRFTNNGVHQNGFQDLAFYTLCMQTKKGPVYIESNDWIPKRGLTPFGLKSKECFPFDLNKTPEMAGEAIEKALRKIRSHRASANGYYSAFQRFFYFANSRGEEMFHPATAVRFGVTATKGEGKGYLSFYHPDTRQLDVTDTVEGALALAERAAVKGIQINPGVYECVFSPRAILEFIEPLRRHFDAHLTQDKKSVFSGRVGKKIFSDTFSLSDDITHPCQFGIPFDAEGVPKQKVELIKKGVLHGLLREGHSTRGILEHPFYPENLVIKGGTLSLADIFKKIRRGIFINKIWYHTLVRESKMEVTGLATAGSLFIEKGKIKGRAVNLRYHDSLFSILRSVLGCSREQILLKDGERGAALFPYLWVSHLRVL